MSNLFLLVGSIVGFVASVVLLILGVYSGDRWLSVAALVGAIAFGLALVIFGMVA